MTPLIETFTIIDALQVIDLLKDADAEVAQKYFSGDAWQDGNAWVGPAPAEGDEDTDDVLAEIEAGLVSKNCLAEVIGRHRDALIGKEPDWSFTVRRPLKDDEQPKQQESDLIEEAEAALTEWWDERQALSFIQEACANLLLSNTPETLIETQVDTRRARSCLRLFVPPALVGDDGAVPKSASVMDALKMLYLHTPNSFQSTVYIDPDSQERVGIYAFQHRTGLNGSDEQRVELHGLDSKQQTIIKMMSNAETVATTQPLQLGGHLAIFEMRRQRFITPQVTQLQALVNMALTMMARNVVLGGFLARVLLNAQIPGKFVDDPDRPGKKKFVADVQKVGASSTNAYAGLPIYGDSSRPDFITGYTSPSIVYRDPVPVQTFTDTLSAAYNCILDEVSQRHVVMASDATASGESRRQAMAAFLTSVLATKAQIEAAGRWLLETSLAMAAQFAGQPGRYAGLRASFSCRLDVGPIPIDEQTQAIALRDAKIIDTENAMQRVGVEDPDAMIERVKKEQEAQPVQPPAAGQPVTPAPSVQPPETTVKPEVVN